MTRITFPLSVLAIALLGLLHTVPAQAQPIRVFVALTGNDANPCTFASPCKSAQHAHDVVAAGGEIRMLDPGSYGLLTITKAISIQGHGWGGIAASGGATAITINAGPTDAISLQGLILQGFGVGSGNGIVFNSGSSLTVENCTIRNFTGSLPIGIGILFQPNASSNLAVSNTLVAENENLGIEVEPTGSGSVTASLSRVEVYSGGNLGIRFSGGSSTGTINAVVEDSVASNHRNGSGFGLLSFSSVGHASTNVMAIRFVSANNKVGVQVANAATATLRIGQSTVTGSLIHSWVAGGGILQSYGDNNIDGNADGDPAIPTVIGKK